MKSILKTIEEFLGRYKGDEKARKKNIENFKVSIEILEKATTKLSEALVSNQIDVRLVKERSKTEYIKNE